MKVSIVVPIFNSEKTLDACLGAIRRTRAPDTELIVVDDGSTDGSVAIAQKYTDQVVEHGNNLGRSHARNTGVERTRGELVLFIDSDVVVRPDTVATVSEYFARHADVDALSGSGP